MQRFAYIENGRVREIIEVPEGLIPGADIYSPEFAQNMVACDDPGVAAGWRWNGQFSAPDVAVDPGASAPSPLSSFTYKSDVVRRSTDDEAKALKAALDGAPAKLSLLWPSIQRIEHNAPEFGALRDAIVATVGEERADVLLAPSA